MIKNLFGWETIADLFADIKNCDRVEHPLEGGDRLILSSQALPD
ncbi:MAG: hypothetical protein V7L02_01795 [Nostoc sp.]